jgi:hypothetical protein
VAEGTPEEVAAVRGSATGEVLAPVLDPQRGPHARQPRVGPEPGSRVGGPGIQPQPIG